MRERGNYFSALSQSTTINDKALVWRQADGGTQSAGDGRSRAERERKMACMEAKRLRVYALGGELLVR
jgi:hypothetical protein